MLIKQPPATCLFSTYSHKFGPETKTERGRGHCCWLNYMYWIALLRLLFGFKVDQNCFFFDLNLFDRLMKKRYSSILRFSFLFSHSKSILYKSSFRLRKRSYVFTCSVNKGLIIVVIVYLILGLKKLINHCDDILIFSPDKPSIPYKTSFNRAMSLNRHKNHVSSPRGLH